MNTQGVGASERQVLQELFEASVDVLEAAERGGNESLVQMMARSIARSVSDRPALWPGCVSLGPVALRKVDEAVERLGGPRADRDHEWVVVRSFNDENHFFSPSAPEPVVEGLVSDDQIVRSDLVSAQVRISAQVEVVGVGPLKPSIADVEESLRNKRRQTCDAVM